MTHISSLTLNAFRNYDHTAIDGLGAGFVVLIGQNGAGKTNCLEAVSLLSPGRGLRGASVDDYQNKKQTQGWAVSALLTDTDGDAFRLGVGRDPQRRDKKLIRHNGETVRSQQDLGELNRTIWLTPQMDGLFLQGAGERRAFFDRMVATFDPSHSGRLTRYEKAMRERLKILKTACDKNQKADATWLDGLENVMAETAIAIAAARLDCLTKLQPRIYALADALFPAAELSLSNGPETALNGQSALRVETDIKTQLVRYRDTDGMSGRTHIGAHRTDMNAIYKNKNAPAAQCSTGEQKALLTTIILAHAQMVAARFGAPPILLFDEIAAHFDATHRNALFDILGAMGGQVWLTGQEKQAFSSIPYKNLCTIENNHITPCE